MAKRKNDWTEAKIKRYIQEGRGQGELENYKPWLTTQSFSTSGNGPRWRGWKTNRMHEFFSDLEKYYFFILEWASEVIDIREQFYLDRTETFEIAEKLGIEHPMDQKNKTLIPLTTDFVITVNHQGENKYLAHQVKYSNDLEDSRVIEKFEIEYVYWKQKGVDFKIITEQDIPLDLAKNVMNVHKQYYLKNELDFSYAENLVSFIDYYKASNPKYHLIEVCDEFDEQYTLDVGTSLEFSRHLIARNKLRINMYEKFNPRKIHLKDIELLNSGKEVGKSDSYIG